MGVDIMILVRRVCELGTTQTADGTVNSMEWGRGRGGIGRVRPLLLRPSGRRHFPSGHLQNILPPDSNSTIVAAAAACGCGGDGGIVAVAGRICATASSRTTGRSTSGSQGTGRDAQKHPLQCVAAVAQVVGKVIVLLRLDAFLQQRLLLQRRRQTQTLQSSKAGVVRVRIAGIGGGSSTGADGVVRGATWRRGEAPMATAGPGFVVGGSWCSHYGHL
mmetsp:Transcript_12568/g.29786  ORF Transcript_12568/g.29786 Transcript_12568/m.29786 type:complete len:218 (-) Transcript_12568:315-968(-)